MILFSDGGMFCGLAREGSPPLVVFFSAMPLSAVSQGHPLKGAEQRLAVICQCYSIVTGQSGPLAAVLNNASAFKGGPLSLLCVCVF